MLTVFIGSSLALTMPVSLAPRSVAARDLCHPTSRRDGTLAGATLSGELHTPPLPVTHVSVGYCQSHDRFAIGVRPRGRDRSNNNAQSFALRVCFVAMAQMPGGTKHTNVTPPVAVVKPLTGRNLI